jgi:predicted transcriptional regulator
MAILMLQSTKLPRWMIISNEFKKYPYINVSLLSYITHTTYSHTSKILKILENKHIIKLKKVGRANKIIITPEGNKLIDICQALIKELNILNKEKEVKLSDEMRKKLEDLNRRMQINDNLPTMQESQEALQENTRKASV